MRFVRSFDEGARFLISFAVAEMTGKLQTDPSLFRKSGERLLQHPLQDRWILHPHRDMDHLLIQPAMIVVEIKRRAIVREGAREAAVCLIPLMQCKKDAAHGAKQKRIIPTKPLRLLQTGEGAGMILQRMAAYPLMKTDIRRKLFIVCRCEHIERGMVIPQLL